jgi:hypothetical protein
MGKKPGENVGRKKKSSPWRRNRERKHSYSLLSGKTRKYLVREDEDGLKEEERRGSQPGKMWLPPCGVCRPPFVYGSGGMQMGNGAKITAVRAEIRMRRSDS